MRDRRMTVNLGSQFLPALKALEEISESKTSQMSESKASHSESETIEHRSQRTYSNNFQNDKDTYQEVQVVPEIVVESDEEEKEFKEDLSRSRTISEDI